MGTRKRGRAVGWVAKPVYAEALAEAMKERGIEPLRLAEEIRRSSSVRVSRQRISQLRKQQPPAGCRLDLAEQISKVLGTPFNLLWQVIPTNEAARKLSDQRVTVSTVRNTGAQTAQAGRPSR